MHQGWTVWCKTAWLCKQGRVRLFGFANRDVEKLLGSANLNSAISSAFACPAVTLSPAGGKSAVEDAVTAVVLAAWFMLQRLHKWQTTWHACSMS
jgi:hypothetical protein